MVNTDESTALIANDVRVLISEINLKLEEAARLGLDVSIEESKILKLSHPKTLQSSLRVTIRAEVE